MRKTLDGLPQGVSGSSVFRTQTFERWILRGRKFPNRPVGGMTEPRGAERDGAGRRGARSITVEPERLPSSISSTGLKAPIITGVSIRRSATRHRLPPNPASWLRKVVYVKSRQGQ